MKNLLFLTQSEKNIGLVLTLFVFILAATIFTGSFEKLSDCNVDTAKIAIAPRIFADVTADGPGKNIAIVRFLHNKPGIYLSEFSRCYFNAYSLNYIFSILGPIGFVSFIYFVYNVFVLRKWWAIFIILILPLLPFLKLNPFIFILAYKTIASIGIFVLLQGRSKYIKRNAQIR